MIGKDHHQGAEPRDHLSAAQPSLGGERKAEGLRLSAREQVWHEDT